MREAEGAPLRLPHGGRAGARERCVGQRVFGLPLRGVASHGRRSQLPHPPLRMAFSADSEKQSRRAGVATARGARPRTGLGGGCPTPRHHTHPRGGAASGHPPPRSVHGLAPLLIGRPPFTPGHCWNLAESRLRGATRDSTRLSHPSSRPISITYANGTRPSPHLFI